MKYRKKPVVIEAVQIRNTDDSFSELVEFFQRDVDERTSALASLDLVGPGVVVTASISTLEGEMEAKAGDWIIRGIEGELYPCAERIFRKTYEQVLEDGVDVWWVHVRDAVTHNVLAEIVTEVERRLDGGTVADVSIESFYDVNIGVAARAITQAIMIKVIEKGSLGSSGARPAPIKEAR